MNILMMSFSINSYELPKWPHIFIISSTHFGCVFHFQQNHSIYVFISFFFFLLFILYSFQTYGHRNISKQKFSQQNNKNNSKSRREKEKPTEDIISKHLIQDDPFHRALLTALVLLSGCKLLAVVVVVDFHFFSRLFCRQGCFFFFFCSHSLSIVCVDCAANVNSIMNSTCQLEHALCHSCVIISRVRITTVLCLECFFFFFFAVIV